MFLYAEDLEEGMVVFCLSPAFLCCDFDKKGEGLLRIPLELLSSSLSPGTCKGLHYGILSFQNLLVLICYMVLLSEMTK